MSSVDGDLVDLDRIVVNIRGMNVDTAAMESYLANLRRRNTAVHDNGVSKLTRLLTVISSAEECEHEYEAVLKWMKDAENQLQALDSDRSLLAEDKHRQLEVHVNI